MDFKQQLLHILNESVLTETILDKGILKAFMIIGGPGAGKSFIVSKITESLTPPPKVLDADKLLEFKMKKRELPLKWAGDQTSDTFKKQWSSRVEALQSTEKLYKNYLNGYLSIILDGTGQNYKKTIGRRDLLQSLGYDIMMISIDVDIDVAQKRNAGRARSIAPPEVVKIWEGVRKNKPMYINEFPNFLEVNNNSDIPNDSKEYPEYIKKFIKQIQQFFNSPVQNEIGQEIIKNKDSLPMYRDVKMEID